MPIALLPEVARSLAEAARRLAGWERLAPLEEQILRRARGAFLVKWFGPSLPEHRLNLHVAIANVGELKARLDLAQRSMPGRSSELNLTAPLAALGGTLFGAALSVSGTFLIFDHLQEIYSLIEDNWKVVIGKLLYSVIGNWVKPVAGPGLVAAVGLPFLAALGFALVAGGDRTLRAVHGLLGDAAMLVDAFLGFWDQVTGPVERIRNPLVRALVALAHRLAELFAQVLGFVAIVVVKVLPLVPWLMEQFRAAKALGESVVAAVSDAVAGIGAALLEPFGKGGPAALLSFLLNAMMALPTAILDAVTFLIDATLIELGHAGAALGKLLGDWGKGLRDRIVAAFEATPVGQLVARIKVLTSFKAELLTAWANRNGPPTDTQQAKAAGSGGNALDELDETLRSRWVAGITGSAEGGLTGGIWGGITGRGVGPRIADAIGAARAIRLPWLRPLALPAFPPLPDLPDSIALHSIIGAPAPRDFGAEAERLLAEARAAEDARALPRALTRRPRSAFAEELARNPAPPPPDALQLALRDMIYLAVGRVLPAALRLHAPTLREAFDAIDREVYGVEPTAGAPLAHPQQELPDSGLLRPVVERLTIRSRGGYAPDLRAFRDLLTAAMQAQSYRAADAVPAGG